MGAREELEERFSALGELKELLAHTVLSDADFMALLAIHRAGAASARAVAEALGHSPATTSRCLRRLAALDLIEEEVDKADRRRLVLSLSNSGGNVVFDIERTLGHDRVAAAFDFFSQLHRGAAESRATLGVPVSATEQGIVAVLSLADRPIRIGELARNCRLAQSKASMAVRALARKGVVVLSSVSDRRGCAVELGKQAAEALNIHQ